MSRDTVALETGRQAVRPPRKARPSHIYRSPVLAAVLGLPAVLVDAGLWVYQATLSPLLGPSCRFVPSCSAYGREAVQHYGVLRGGWMTLKRLLRCHPFHPGGWDPIP